MIHNNLVYIDEYNLLGSNFYWKNRHRLKGVTDKELNDVGLVDERVQVSSEIIDKLISINKELQTKGYRLYIKEGLRPKKLYELIYRKRVEMFGKERTDKLLNMKDMPHASGKTIDASFYNLTENKETYLRNKEDGDDALFIDYYRNKNDEVSKHYQHLQDLLMNIMQSHGFRIGKKHEYFHFDYKPDTEPDF